MQRCPLQQARDSPAAPVTAYGGQTVLGPVGHVAVREQAGRPDDLARRVERQKRRRRIRDPLAFPFLQRQLHRRAHRHVRDTRQTNLVVRHPPQLRPLRHGDHRYAHRGGRFRLVRRNQADLLDLTIDLGESGVLGESRGSRIVRVGRGDRITLRCGQCQQMGEECAADTLPPVLRQHARRDRSGTA
jgi:hypothetical protein